MENKGLAAVAAAATSAAFMYLNAKFSISKDISQISAGFTTQKYIEQLYQSRGEDDWSFYHVIHSTYGTNHHSDLEALVFEDRSWTYRQIREEIGRLAEALQALGVVNRTVVAVLMDNSPEFLLNHWALQKLGAIPAPINTSITGEHIRHCLTICGAEFAVTSNDLYANLARAIGFEGKKLDIGPGSNNSMLKNVVLYDYNTYPQLATEMIASNVTHFRHEALPRAGPQTADFPTHTRPKIRPTDASQYLFTSGTTGLPKALIWPMMYSHVGSLPGRWPYHLSSTKKPLRYYVCLPLFHGTALLGAVGPTLGVSGTIVLARRFSRRNFWADVRRHKANGIVYIGEMLRYLVQAPPDPQFPNEKDHGVEFAYGLGLSPAIWRSFRERFGVPWIVEYYSASEATMALVNSNHNDYGVAKVAHWGPLMRRWQTTFYTVRIDQESGEIYRHPITGFCERTKPGEVGESICRITPPLLRKHNYIGPGGDEATEKKTLRNVFAKGDEFFRLGDALMFDQDGFISFQDRLGDTFRAKGHNISTTEVENCLGRHPDIVSVNVYAIPMNVYGYEGQLGCAAITLRGNESGSDGAQLAAEQSVVQQLEHWVTKNESALPSYAVPRFLRILTESKDENKQDKNDTTGAESVSTIMKKIKVALRKEGFTLPPESKDRMYWIEEEGSGYVPLTPDTGAALRSGSARL